MYAKAVRKGMLPAAGGSFSEVAVGQVVEIADSMVLKPTSFLVRCDKSGEITDPIRLAEDAKAARGRANALKEAATIAVNAAKEADTVATALEKKAAPKDPPKV